MIRFATHSRTNLPGRWLRMGSVLLLSSGLAACTGLSQDVDPGLVPTTPPQLVVHCYLSPQDSVLVAAVSLSRTAIGTQTATNSYNSLPTASVTLSEGSRSVRLLYEPERAIYRADPGQFPIQAGHTYALSVSTPDGLTAGAHTTVPPLVPITRLRVDSAQARFESAMDYFVQFSWQDPAGRANYYQVAGDNEYGSVVKVFQNNMLVDTPYRAVGTINYGVSAGQYLLLTDEDRDGQAFESPSGRLSYTISNGQRLATPPLTANVYLLNVDETYYQYHRSLDQQQTTSGNPYSEPTWIRGNIQGGLGCFGSYSRSRLSTRVK